MAACNQYIAMRVIMMGKIAAARNIAGKLLPIYYTAWAIHCGV